MNDVNLALILAVIGMGVVFGVLLLFHAIVTVLVKTLRDSKDGQSAAPTVAAAPAAAVSAPVAASTTASLPAVHEVELVDVEEKTAAIIMAIVSHETEIPLENLKFLSIKASKEGPK